MAQADGVVANGTGSAVRTDINGQYAALWSNHSGSTEPSSGKVAYQLWADTNSGYLKIRNAANNAWIQLFKLDGTLSDIPVEGTVIKSTGESGGTKFLREDGDGTCSWQTVAAGVALTGSTNNQITTVTGANAIQGESGLTFDGSTLNFTAASGDARLTLIGTEGNDARITLSADDGDDHIDQWNIRAEAANHFAIDQFSGGSFVERLRIGTEADNGDVTVKTGNLVIGTNGKGIEFYNYGTGTNISSNLLNDYEEGGWTPTAAEATHYATQTGRYTKIGNMVYAYFNICWYSSSSNQQIITNLPFTSSNSSGGTGGVARGYQNKDIQDGPIYHIGTNTDDMYIYKDGGVAFPASDGSGNNFSGYVVYQTDA